MTGSPVVVGGLADVAEAYDALICDVWGVLHDGVAAFPAAVEALTRFRAQGGKVVLLSNAPRPPDAVRLNLRGYGVPDEAYDGLVTSGGAAREDLAARSRKRRVKFLLIGAPRDEPVYAGLDVEPTGPDEAEVVLCTNLIDDTVETPDDYAAMLQVLKARGLTMICANPDVMVPRGDALVWCAGAIARAYEKLGGAVVWYGKPRPAIYRDAVAAAGGPDQRLLVVGDALETDIAGANAMGFDALFVAGGLHRDELETLTGETLAAFFARAGMTARFAVDVLKW